VGALQAGNIVWKNGVSRHARGRSGVHSPGLDAAFPLEVAVRFFRRQSRSRLIRQDYVQILFLESGELAAQVADRILRVETGDLFVIGKALPYSLKKNDCAGRTSAQALAVRFLQDVIRSGDLTHEDIEYLSPFLAQHHDFPHVIPAASGVPAQVRDLMLRMQAEVPARSDLNRLAAKTYLKLILVLLSNYYAGLDVPPPFTRRQERDLERLKPVLDFIDKRYAERFTLDKAAELLHMSPSHFMRLFRRATGEPLVPYLNRFRVAKAEALLASTNKSIAQVSQEVGFCDQSYFGYVFRKLLHITPREYRDHRRGSVQ